MPIWLQSLVRRGHLGAFAAGAACCVFAAHAVAALAEGAYLGPAAHGPPAPPVRQVAPRPPPDGGALVARDMFCSDCGPGPDLPVAVGDYRPDAELIAIAIGVPPLATLRVADGAVQGSWAEGDHVPQVGTILRIGWQSVEVRADDGRTGILHLAGAAGSGAATHEPPPGPWADRIRPLGQDRYEVDRTLVRGLVQGGAVPRGFMIGPAVEHGAMAGLRVAGVRPDSLAAALGLHSGDVIAAIDGAPIRSAESVLDVYAKLDDLSHVELDVTRAGARHTIDLELR